MTSRKYGIFINQPISHRPVTTLPGIWFAAQLKFKEIGVEHAHQILGMFLYYDTTKFMEWLAPFVYRYPDRVAYFNALDEYCRQYVLWI